MTSLRRLRRSRGKSQEECARFLAVSRSYYSQIESGARRMSLSMAARLAEFLGASLDEVYSCVSGAAASNMEHMMNI